jgi:glycosyltransferase involved in cell wall biosynthesis
LDIVGDGDLAPSVSAAAQKFPTIHWHGRLEKAKVYERMKTAALLVLPSIWYEAFPMVITEAFAMGLPVVASRLGAMATIVRHECTGLHFRPGDPADLAAKVRWFHDHQQAAIRMRKEARRDFELHHTGERNYSSLMTIYGDTIARYCQDEHRATEPLGCSTQSRLDLVQITSDHRRNNILPPI